MAQADGGASRYGEETFEEIVFVMPSYRKIEFNGPSLSFGNTKILVEVLESNPQLTPRVSWRVGDKIFYSTDCAKCFGEMLHSVARTTVYSRIGSSVDAASGAADVLNLGSPEHLAPVFLMWPSRRFNVTLLDKDCPEIPMMDGSALPFFSALRREAGLPEELAFYNAPINAEWDLCAYEGAVPFGHVRIMPAETFEVEYTLDRPELGLKSSAYMAIFSAEDLYNIFMSRTFIYRSEYDEARKGGLLAGVDEKCGLLLNEGKWLTDKSKFRVADEPARHKILDLLGDITFIYPALPRVRIEITNGGHVSHRQIMERLIPYVSAGHFEKIR